MNRSKKKILSLSQQSSQHKHLSREKSEAVEEDKIVVGNIDLALPCRHFLVDYKVASSEKFSPTLEFLLRLVHSAPGIERGQVAAFFGYNDDEIAFVVGEATVHGFVSEADSRLNLTIAGRDLFEKSSDGPRLFSVRKKIDKVSFDLLSTSPTSQKNLRVKSLPELPISKEAASKGVSKEIQINSLRRFFGELGLSRSREGEAPSTLYSVDNVRADSRFQESIPISLLASISSPSNVTADLSEWRPDHEIADRLEIEREVAKFVDTLKTLSRTGDGDEAYDVLSEIFPDYLDRFSTRRGLNVERFWREVAGQDPSPRVNRKTVPVVGSLFTKKNSRAIGQVIEYGAKNFKQTLKREGTDYCWTGPQIPTWAASSVARNTNDLIKTKIADTSGGAVNIQDIENLCLFPGSPPLHLRHVFDFVIDNGVQSFPRELEVLFIPGILVAVSVHAPIMLNLGFPTPLGAMSFDVDTLERTHNFLSHRLCNNGDNRIQKFLKDAKMASDLMSEGLEPE